MKTAIMFLLASCVISLAQTNTDSSGYVTNANLLAPFTLTNSVGDVITDAVLVKLTANKFVYKTPSGAMGMLRLDSLSKDLQEKFGYDPQAAQAADEAEKQKKVRLQQYDQQQRENVAAQAAQAAIWKQVQRYKSEFDVTGDTLRVDQVTKEGILASYNHVDSEPDLSFSMVYFVKDYPKKDALSDGETISGPFYEIGSYTYTSVMGSSKTIQCLTCSPNVAFQYYSMQAGVQADKQNEAYQQQIKQQQLEAAVPKAARDIVWQRVQAHETNFDNGGLAVRQITKEGILASFDFESDEPGRSYSISYFVKDSPQKDTLVEGRQVNNPFYEIGTYTYTSVMGSSKTLRCLTCSSNAAFQYYLNH